jgi:SAM-dependent methyltransferase
MLKQIHRVLRPGGRLRIATPDMDNFIHFKSGNLTPAELDYIRWSNGAFGDEFERASRDNPCCAINRMFRAWGHQFIYDRPTLAHVLSCTGFRDVTFYEIGQSDVPELQDLETHGLLMGEDFNRVETMIAEAVKPGRGN